MSDSNIARQHAKTCEHIFKRVDSRGAQADVIVSESDSLSLKANAGELEEHTVSNTQTFGVRVIYNEKVGIAYSETNDDDSLNWMVDQALQNATYSAVEPDEKILNTKDTLSTDDAILCPTDAADIDKKIKMVLQLEQGLLEKEDVKSVPYNGFSEAQSSYSLFSSHGLYAVSRERKVYSYAYALAEEGEKNAMEGTGQMYRLTDHLDIPGLIDTVATTTLDMLHGSPIPSKHYDVVFDQECQVQLFDVFSMMLSAKAAKEGVNPWRDRLGDKIADSRLNLWDKPTLSTGFGYSLFDDEGTTAVDRALIAGGVLETLLHNSVTAKHFGVQTTGHATRGARTTLGVGAHQIVIEPGDAGSSELYAGEYVEITSMAGLHSGANAISGDFSLGVSGFLCKDGKRVQPVRGITVAGNFYKMLRQIQCIGTESHWNWQKSSNMPAIRFDGLAISGE